MNNGSHSTLIIFFNYSTMPHIIIQNQKQSSWLACIKNDIYSIAFYTHIRIRITAFQYKTSLSYAAKRRADGYGVTTRITCLLRRPKKEILCSVHVQKQSFKTFYKCLQITVYIVLESIRSLSLLRKLKYQLVLDYHLCIAYQPESNHPRLFLVL